MRVENAFCLVLVVFAQRVETATSRTTIRVLQVIQDVRDVISPLHGSIGHTEVDLSCLFEVSISSLLRDLHSSIEMFCRCVKVALLCEKLTELHVSTGFALAVLEFVGELEVALHEHLHLVLVEHGRLHVLTADLTQVANRNTLPSNTAHLHSVTQREVMVDRRLLMIANVVVDDTEVNVREEFTCDISNLLVLVVELDGVLVEVDFICFS